MVIAYMSKNTSMRVSRSVLTMRPRAMTHCWNDTRTLSIGELSMGITTGSVVAGFAPADTGKLCVVAESSSAAAAIPKPSTASSAVGETRSEAALTSRSLSVSNAWSRDTGGIIRLAYLNNDVTNHPGFSKLAVVSREISSILVLLPFSRPLLSPESPVELEAGLLRFVSAKLTLRWFCVRSRASLICTRIHDEISYMNLANA
ncbi:hypothetical protein GGI06_003686 [Coemansia sp. S85]|nr:hypothetical protein GGI06_003686 [Coemansia sp. S85]